MPDPQAPKVDERRWKLLGPANTIVAAIGGPATRCHGPLLELGEVVEVVPASLVDKLRAERDMLRDAIAEIAQARSLGEVMGILANGPLATAPGGPREDERARLRERCVRAEAERDALRAEAEWLRGCCKVVSAAKRDAQQQCGNAETATIVEQAEVHRLRARVRELEDGTPCEVCVGDGMVVGFEGNQVCPACAGYGRSMAAARAEGARQERERVRAALDEMVPPVRFVVGSDRKIKLRAGDPEPESYAFHDGWVDCHAALTAVLSEEAR